MNGDTVEYHHKFNGNMFIYNSGTESILVFLPCFHACLCLLRKKGWLLIWIDRNNSFREVCTVCQYNFRFKTKNSKKAGAKFVLKLAKY
jgi:hypothetical protein